MSYLSWRYLHTELATENYQARVFGISAEIVRIGLEQVTRKETTVTRRMNFVVFVLRCITMKMRVGKYRTVLVQRNRRLLVHYSRITSSGSRAKLELSSQRAHRGIATGYFSLWDVTCLLRISIQPQRLLRLQLSFIGKPQAIIFGHHSVRHSSREH
jgi:hypothetical protein